MLKLHPYQDRAVRLIMQKRIVYLMADVGLGKTVMALTAIEKTGIPALVLAPITPMYTTWPDEIKKWTPGLSYTILHGPDKLQKAKRRVDIYLMNYEGLKWYLTCCSQKQIPMRKMFLVLDESSFVKDPTTQRFEILKRLRPLRSRFMLCLSATPSANGLHELWSQYYLLDGGLRLRPTYYSFRSKYFTYTGPPRFKTTPLPGAKEKIYERIHDITFRLDGADYLQLPKVTYNSIRIQLPPKARKVYDDLEKAVVAEFNDGSKIVAENAAQVAMKLRQIVQGAVYRDRTDGKRETVYLHRAKIDALKELLEGVAGNPILCPIQFRFELELIKKYIDPSVPVIAGGTPATKSRMYIKSWNRGNLPLLVCHPASLGHGTNLQAGGHVVLWFAMTWSMEQYVQLNGRLARQGQKHGVVVNHLTAVDTIDEVLMDVVRGKLRTQAALFAALKEYARKKGSPRG